MEGVHNYGKNNAQFQMQIVPVFPARYTSELGFSRHFYGQQGVRIIHGRLW